MRKAFTLIELMIIIVLSLIFLNFIFTFLFNFVSEVRFLQAGEELAINSYRLGFITSRGFHDGVSNRGGVITLQTNTKQNNFDGNISDNGDYVKLYNYTFKKVKTSGNFKIDYGVAGTIGLHSIEFNATVENLEQNSEIGDATLSYQKLVYAR